MRSIALFSVCIQCLLLIVFVTVVFIFKKPPQPDLVYVIPRDLQPYLQVEKPREVDDPEIVGAAEKLRGKEPTVTAKNTFRRVKGYVRFAGYSRNVRSPSIIIKGLMQRLH